MANYLNNTIVDELRIIMQDDLQVLFNAYLEDAECRLQELSSAVTAADCDLTRRIAHSLKGSSRNIGAAPFSDLCESLELAARDEQIALWDSLLEQMKKSFLATQIQIQQEVLSS